MKAKTKKQRFALLKFFLPEERDELELAINGGKWHCVVTDLDEWLRQEIKYANKKKIDIEIVRSKISTLIAERDIY